MMIKKKYSVPQVTSIHIRETILAGSLTGSFVGVSGKSAPSVNDTQNEPGVEAYEIE